MAEVTEGDTLRAEVTGKTYRVQKVEDGEVHVPGLMPVSKAEIESDIERGAITKL